MFENQVNEIIEKYNNSLKYIAELEELEKKWNDIPTHIYLRYESKYDIDRFAVDSLRGIISTQDIIHTINPIKFQKEHYPTVEELQQKILSIGIDDLYFNLVYYFPVNSRLKYTFSNMEYKEDNVHYSKLYLIAHILWLYNHSEELSKQVESTLYFKQKNGETFIFNGCKFSTFKNGNLKIQFSDAKMFEDFKTRFNKALEQAKAEHERKNNE